jgi:putative peptide zinc metalloprotease protein
MKRTTMLLLSLLATIGLAVPPAAASTTGDPSGGDVNDAVAVNTEDGASVFRLAFSVRKVVDGTVDQQNLAIAYASCTDCRTVALAFQVVLVVGGADVVVPENQAAALNDQCVECLTFASATQIVIGVDGPVTLTPEGRKRLHELEKEMKALEDELDTLTASQLVGRVSAFEQQLIAILQEEIVPARSDEDDGEDGEDESTTTSSTAEQSTTSTSSSTTSSTAAPSTTSTTDGA